MNTTCRVMMLAILPAIVVGICSAPQIALAEQATTSPVVLSNESSSTPRRLSELDRENRKMKSELVDLRLQVHDMEAADAGFDFKSAVLTFVITTGLVTVSYYAADRAFGESTREVMPGLTTPRILGFGALAGAIPAFVAGIGNGFDSPAIVSAGITVDVLLALAPWGIGALASEAASYQHDETIKVP